MIEVSDITPHMEVVDTDGRHIGTVDHAAGDLIKLSKSDSADGMHHYLPLIAVERRDGERLVLKQGTPAPMSEAEIVAASRHHGGASSDVNRPLFGTSGMGTGMGGSGRGEH